MLLWAGLSISISLTFAGPPSHLTKRATLPVPTQEELDTLPKFPDLKLEQPRTVYVVKDINQDTGEWYDSSDHNTR
ncbi:MAG: hypothetical protein M1833_004507 [Piccolia ochrophora]|nr:MAG: hypothetical protein M1833_004507 [Piccolia ochrophora]